MPHRVLHVDDHTFVRVDPDRLTEMSRQPGVLLVKDRSKGDFHVLPAECVKQSVERFLNHPPFIAALDARYHGNYLSHADLYYTELHHKASPRQVSHDIELHMAHELIDPRIRERRLRERSQPKRR